MIPSATKNNREKTNNSHPTPLLGRQQPLKSPATVIDVVLHNHSANHTHEVESDASSFGKFVLDVQDHGAERGATITSWRRYSARQPALDSPLRVSLPAKNDERHAGNVFLAGVPVPEEREIPVNWLRTTSSSMYSPHSWRATTYQGPEFLKKLLEYLVVTQSSSKEWIIGLQIERITQMSIEISVMRAVLPLHLCHQARMWWQPSQRTYHQPSCLKGSCNVRPLKKDCGNLRCAVRPCVTTERMYATSHEGEKSTGQHQ